MTDRVAQLLGEVLNLPLDERLKIADAVYASVEGPAPGPGEQEEIDAAWREEIRRRAARVLAGEPGIPWEEVEAEMEARLRRPPRS